MKYLSKFLFSLLLGVLLIFFVAIFDCLVHSAISDDVVNLEELSVVGRQYFSGGYDPLITENANLPHRGLGQDLNLNLDVSEYKVLYQNAIVHSTTDTREVSGDSAGQFRLIGLEFNVGIHLFDNMDISYYHYSQHLLDTEYSGGHFPVKDAIELKIYLYKPKQNNGLL